MADDCPDRDLLCINVGGREFWTYYSTLERLPGTTLSRIAREKHSHETWMESRKSYFFDRSPDAFRSVLEYYRCVHLLLCVLYFIQSVYIICISPSSNFHNLHFKNSSSPLISRFGLQKNLFSHSDSVVQTQNFNSILIVTDTCTVLLDFKSNLRWDICACDQMRETTSHVLWVVTTPHSCYLSSGSYRYKKHLTTYFSVT